MIDYDAVQKAYDSGGVYSLQLEVGDICRQNCIYCYMNAIEVHRNRLSEEIVYNILEDSKKTGVSAIEWLGGEPLLRENIFDFMEAAAKAGFRNNMWTGGLPLINSRIRKKTAELCRFGLISFHISTIDPSLYKEMHPQRPADDLREIENAVKKLIEEEGYPPEQMLNSVTYTGLQSAEDMIKTIDYFNEKYRIKTSLNVYHTYLRPGFEKSDLKRFLPKRSEVKKLYKYYAKHWNQKQLPMNCVNKQYCSATIAVLYNGKVTPCATIRSEDAPVVSRKNSLKKIFEENRGELTFKRFKDKNNLPEKCRKCTLEPSCWGCRSRSYAAGNGIYGKDPGCFRYE